MAEDKYAELRKWLNGHGPFEIEDDYLLTCEHWQLITDLLSERDALIKEGERLRTTRRLLARWLPIDANTMGIRGLGTDGSRTVFPDDDRMTPEDWIEFAETEIAKKEAKMAERVDDPDRTRREMIAERVREAMASKE